MLRGLFIGIDQYGAPVSRLSCARHDAEALAALFVDSIEGDAVVLVDGDATRNNISAELSALADAHPEDLVIVSFSGHGTPCHELVPVDVDVDNIVATALHLDELAALLDAVPAKNLFVILDCCFSGGFGGERAFAPVRERDMLEDRASLTRLGHGRVVLTASGAGEPALETSQLGHGLLTHYLLNALQGPPELADEPHLPLPALLQYVVRHVIDDADTMGATQTPTIYSSLQGDAHLPRLTPGPRWTELHPDSAAQPVTADWYSLEAHGLPKATLDRWAEAMPGGMNDLQQRAVNDHDLLRGSNLLVVAPTSSGKTMVGEIAAVAAAARGGRAVFLLPLKALVNDKYDALRAVYGSELTVIRATGDHADQIDDLLGGHYDIALLTYEKFTALVLGRPHILRGVDTVVVDEAQMIADRNRGANLEFALTLLRRGYGSTSPVQLVALSAVTGPTAGLERWLNAELLHTDRRPIPLIESVIDTAGRRLRLDPDGHEQVDDAFVVPEFGSGSQDSKPWVIGLVRRLVQEGKKVIVFRNWKPKTVGTAAYLGDALGLGPAENALAALPSGDAAIATDALHRVLERGVAFHNADLEPTERGVIEAEFRDPDSNLRIVVATTTLAMGINTPAEAVVIAGLDHSRNDPYSVAEYKNMVGRAGRLGHAAAGESYLLATDELSVGRAWDHYLQGALEPVASRLLASGSDPRTILLRALVALGGSAPLDDLVGLIESSFAVWQLQAGHDPEATWATSELRGHAHELLEGGFVDEEPDAGVVLTALGRFAGESGIEVKSLLRLSHVLARVEYLEPVDLIAVAQVTTELDDQRIRTHLKSNKERVRWPQFLNRAGVQATIVNNLHVGGENPTLRAKRAAAALYYVSDAPIRVAEDDLLQHVPDDSAAGAIRSIASRTRDVLDAVATVAMLRGGIDCADAADELGVRLEFGVPAEMVTVAQLFGAQLTRGDYLALHRAGLFDPMVIDALPDADLTAVVGAATRDRIRGPAAASL